MKLIFATIVNSDGTSWRYRWSTRALFQWNKKLIFELILIKSYPCRVTCGIELTGHGATDMHHKVHVGYLLTPNFTTYNFCSHYHTN